MAKRSSSIYHLKDGERQLCKGLWRTGTMKVQDARKHFDVTDKRYKQMLKEGYIEKRGNLLRLGPSGQRYLENKLGMQ